MTEKANKYTIDAEERGRREGNPRRRKNRCGRVSTFYRLAMIFTFYGVVPLEILFDGFRVSLDSERTPENKYNNNYGNA